MSEPKKTSAAKPEAIVNLRLSCIFSGAERSWNAGELVPLDAAEAARLEALGVVTSSEGKG